MRRRPLCNGFFGASASVLAGVLLAGIFGTARAVTDEPKQAFREATHCALAVGDSATTLRAVLDAEWEWRAAQFPEDATGNGDHRYDARLTDRSPAAVAQRRNHHRQFLAQIRCINRQTLEGEDRLSWDIFSYFADLAVRQDELLLSMARGPAAPWSSDDSPFSVTPMDGPQIELPMLVRETRFTTFDDYTHYLARLQIGRAHV